MTGRRCPDCNASPTGNKLTHQHGCPTGNAMDATTASDNAWFGQHPNASWFYRQVASSEYGFILRAEDLDPLGDHRLVGKVLVHRLVGGGRRPGCVLRPSRRLT